MPVPTNWHRKPHPLTFAPFAVDHNDILLVGIHPCIDIFTEVNQVTGGGRGGRGDGGGGRGPGNKYYLPLIKHICNLLAATEHSSPCCQATNVYKSTVDSRKFWDIVVIDRLFELGDESSWCHTHVQLCVCVCVCVCVVCCGDSKVQ